MIVDLEIEGLRGIVRGKLEGMRSMTVFVGPNGCGKTTVLEAAALLAAGAATDQAFAILSSRSWLGAGGLTYWFQGDGAMLRGVGESGATQSWQSRLSFGPLSPLLFQAARSSGVDVGLHALHVKASVNSSRLEGEIQFDDNGIPHSHTGVSPFQLLAAVFPPTNLRSAGKPSGGPQTGDLRTAISAIKLSPWYDEFIEYVREIRPNLLSIESIALGERDEPFVFEGPPRKGFPLAFAGEGFKRLTMIAAALAQAENGVVVLDEPEAFAHPRMVDEMVKLFRRATEQGTQVMVSTHSLELVQAIARGFEDRAEKLSVFGLSMENGVLESIRVDGEDVPRRILQLGDDLRL